MANQKLKTKSATSANPKASAELRSKEWFGIMGDGTKAPTNEDYQRLDFMSRHPDKVKNLKAGCRATDVPHYWQPGLRPAIDAAMEAMRRTRND